MVLLNSLSGVLSIVIMIAIGYVLKYKGWFSEESSKLISRLVIIVALPPLMLSTVLTNLSRNEFITMGKGVVVPLLSISICYIISVLLSRMIGINREHRGLFISMFFNSNTIFIGLPVNLSLFGEKSVPFVLLYYIANTTFFWTLGVYYIANTSSKIKKQKLISIQSIKRIMSPPLMGYILALILLLLNIKLPKFIMDTAKYLGNMTTPLSMIFIGICIFSVSIKDVKLTKDMVAIIIGRFIISPLTVFLLSIVIPIPRLMREVFIIQAAMPVMTNTSIIAKAYDADAEYSAVMTVVTTVLSLITVPIYMLLMSSIR
ncbi:AEC family transporter [Clostridium oryzae]|uniref:Membrane transport protein n=1 Tax=Clostridium oryzae TaxID=1450648 RepID=A0A1V4ISG8_9CLOT|nr:AEC family transporter [Clostridium oryzae]OPJ62744.1 membrane transport protein [Clostridium oryzae]